MSIDKIRNIGLDKLVTQVYDFDSLTTDELMCKFAQKINIIIEHLKYVDDRCYNSDKALELKLQYLLDQGLEEQVAKRLLELINNGTLGKLINETLLKDINDKVDNFKIEVNKELDSIEQYINKKYKTPIGFNLFTYEDMTIDKAKIKIDELFNLGIKDIFIVIPSNLENDTITPILTDEFINGIIVYCKSKNFKSIVLKLHLNNSIYYKPTDINTFMNNIETNIIKYSNLSVNNGLNTIIICNELNNIIGIQELKWKDIITQVKNKGLNVGVTYNGFDKLDKSVLNNYIDIIGVNHYPSLTDGGYNISDLNAKKVILEKTVSYCTRLKKKYPNKEIWLSEIGCTRNIDALYQPWNWVFSTEEQSLEPQKIYYKSILEAIGGNKELFDKIYFWSTDEDKTNTFTPIGNTEVENLIKKYMEVE